MSFIIFSKEAAIASIDEHAIGGSMKKLLILTGPTAIGKTDLSLSLAHQLNGEIISGDSVQVYKGLNIGSAKITPEEMDGIPHHLIDVINPNETYTAAHFKKDAELLISEIAQKEKLPILVGGTGLYINGLLYDYGFSEISENTFFRDKISEDIKKYGLTCFYEKLQKLDPKAAEKIKANDEKRIVRALEVIETTGELFSKGHDMKKRYDSPRFDMLYYALTMDRTDLYNRINLRVELMIEKGLVEEVTALLKSGISPDSRSMQAIGYKEIVAYLKGDLSLDEATERIKINTRHFAKRQFTWFRRDPNIRWIDLDDLNTEDAANLICSEVQQRWHY